MPPVFTPLLVLFGGFPTHLSGISSSGCVKFHFYFVGQYGRFQSKMVRMYFYPVQDFMAYMLHLAHTLRYLN